MSVRFILFIPLALSACISTEQDPLYLQRDWIRSDEYKACKAEEDEALAQYEAARLAHEQAESNYDYDAELRRFEQEMAEFEAGQRQIMPLRPSVIGPAGVGPNLPAVGQCLRPPEGWVSE